jgi:hypothetical protein
VSIESMVTVLNSSGLTPRRKLILLGIANHDGDGGAWPSVATLARYAGCSTRTVQREIQALSEAGLVSVDKNAGGNGRTQGNRRPNLYHLTLKQPVDNPELGVTSSVTPENVGVTETTFRGDTHLSPKPSLNRPYTSKRDTDVMEPRVCVFQGCAREPLPHKFRCQEHTMSVSPSLGYYETRGTGS